MEWPPNSPDLNPIKEVWGIVVDQFGSWSKKPQENVKKDEILFLFKLSSCIYNSMIQDLLKIESFL